jgi:hypothetical protein
MEDDREPEHARHSSECAEPTDWNRAMLRSPAGDRGHVMESSRGEAHARSMGRSARAGYIGGDSWNTAR